MSLPMPAQGFLHCLPLAVMAWQRPNWDTHRFQGNHVRTQPAEQLCRERIVSLRVSDRRRRSGRQKWCRD